MPWFAAWTPKPVLSPSTRAMGLMVTAEMEARQHRPRSSPGIWPSTATAISYINEGLQVRMVNATTHINHTVAGKRGGKPLPTGRLPTAMSAMAARHCRRASADWEACSGRGQQSLPAGHDSMRCAPVDAGTQKITTIAGNYSAYAYDTGDINNPTGSVGMVRHTLLHLLNRCLPAWMAWATSMSCRCRAGSARSTSRNR